MRRPSSVRIAGKGWGIRFRPSSQMKGCAGLTTYTTSKIDIATGQSPFDLRDTAIHETFHAILAAHGFERTPEDEERFVLALASGFMGVLQDNPDFAQWLIEPLT